jgi:hypothetical protein
MNAGKKWIFPISRLVTSVLKTAYRGGASLGLPTMALYTVAADIAFRGSLATCTNSPRKEREGTAT